MSGVGWLQASAAPGRQLLRDALECVDTCYRERCRLAAVGPALYLGLERHAGAPRLFGDGTRLVQGGWIGRLHFNNACAAALQAEGRRQAGVRFARLLRDSFAELAERARSESVIREVIVYEGITWLRAHGGTVGFDAQPLPGGPRRWLLGLHFRLLLWAFAPVARGSMGREVAPHHFQITRRALLDGFGARSAARARVGSPRTDA